MSFDFAFSLAKARGRQPCASRGGAGSNPGLDAGFWCLLGAVLCAHYSVLNTYVVRFHLKRAIQIFQYKYPAVRNALFQEEIQHLCL